MEPQEISKWRETVEEMYGIEKITCGIVNNEKVFEKKRVLYQLGEGTP